MKNFATTLGCALCLSFSTFASESEDTSMSSSSAEDIILGQSFQFESSILGDTRRLSVRLPARYEAEPDKAFPVLYLIDGGPEQDFLHIAGILQSTDINWTVEPIILIGIETINRQAELTPPSNEPSYDEIFRREGALRISAISSKQKSCLGLNPNTERTNAIL